MASEPGSPAAAAFAVAGVEVEPPFVSTAEKQRMAPLRFAPVAMTFSLGFGCTIMGTGLAFAPRTRLAAGMTEVARTQPGVKPAHEAVNVEYGQ